MAHADKKPIVGIIMGSRSDWETMSVARDTLAELDIPCEVRVVSAHRMPDEMFEYASAAAQRGLAAIIAGASWEIDVPAKGWQTIVDDCLISPDGASHIVRGAWQKPRSA